MLGDAQDMLRRLKAVLPNRWFPDTAPVLDVVLSGKAAIWSQMWSLLDYVAKQRRISTATDINLELIANDFIGASLPRRASETDQSYRTRIKAAIFQEQGTRAGLISALTLLGSQAPSVFEPANPLDAGGYGVQNHTVYTGMAYGQAGGYGSLQLPFQVFVRPFRAAQTGIANVQGYVTTPVGGASYPPSIGGYGVGAIEFVHGTLVGQLTAADQEVDATVNAVRPAGTTVWLAFQDDSSAPSQAAPPPGGGALDHFVLDQSKAS